MKGLIDFERTPGRSSAGSASTWPSDRRPALTAAITAFSTVVKQYPKSDYAHDALRRLIYLRNRLAEYEVNVARYYMRRGAYVAAAQRAQRLIEQYDGAPAVKDALDIMIECYRKLGLHRSAEQRRACLRDQLPDAPARRTRRSKRWWHLW